jgi:sulfite reductase alpha subunit-like flavoprotein
MLFLASVEGKEEYEAESYSVFEVLDKFPSCEVPFAHFLELCPKIQPRFYTIASSAKVNPTSIHITVTVARQEKTRGRVHEGVASTYLASLRPGKDVCAVFVRASSFRLPRPIATPIIMIGPGTGVAPFRAFWQELKALQSEGVKTGPIELYFGCRYEQKDFIYKDEIQECADSTFTKLHIAFSRDQDKKVYVQDLMAAQHETLWQLVDERNAHIYVCGGTAMGRSVRESFLKMAETHGGLNATNAGLYLKNLQDRHRFIQELWA